MVNSCTGVKDLRYPYELSNNWGQVSNRWLKPIKITIRILPLLFVVEAFEPYEVKICLLQLYPRRI